MHSDGDSLDDRARVITSQSEPTVEEQLNEVRDKLNNQLDRCRECISLSSELEKAASRVEKEVRKDEIRALLHGIQKVREDILEERAKQDSNEDMEVLLSMIEQSGKARMSQVAAMMEELERSKQEKHQELKNFIRTFKRKDEKQ